MYIKDYCVHLHHPELKTSSGLTYIEDWFWVNDFIQATVCEDWSWINELMFRLTYIEDWFWANVCEDWSRINELMTGLTYVKTGSGLMNL